MSVRNFVPQETWANISPGDNTEMYDPDAEVRRLQTILLDRNSALLRIENERDSLKRDLHICALVLTVESVLVVVLAVL